MMACMSFPATANQQRYMDAVATATLQGYSDGHLMCFTGLGRFASISYCLIGGWVILLTDT